MKTHPAFTDAVFHFCRAGRIGRCRLRVFRPGPDRPAVVIVSDLSGPGPGVTDAAGELAAAVCRRHDIDPDTLLFVRHARSATGPGSFATASFDRDDSGRLCRPSWRPVTRRAVEHLAGAPLSD